ncbi:MAG TPA: hypothetical protein VGM81_15410 [Burkholderiaceae bacterium]|jgi:hypothetical protein
MHVNTSAHKTEHAAAKPSQQPAAAGAKPASGKFGELLKTAKAAAAEPAAAASAAAQAALPASPAITS